MRRKKLVFANIAFDAKESKRSIDENGFLHVEISPFTKEQVAPYLGKEIPDFRRMGLEPEKVYHVYRPASELSKPKTVTSIQNIPIQLEHHIENPDNPPTSTRVGTTGQKAKWQAPYLSNSLTIWEARAIDLIKSGAMKELSLGYAYTPIKRAGTFQGEDYDIVMHNIRANHLALVEEGRAGHDAAPAGPQPTAGAADAGGAGIGGRTAARPERSGSRGREGEGALPAGGPSRGRSARAGHARGRNRK